MRFLGAEQSRSQSMPVRGLYSGMIMPLPNPRTGILWERDWELSYIIRLALVFICEIDVTSFSEDGRGVKWLCN